MGNQKHSLKKYMNNLSEHKKFRSFYQPKHKRLMVYANLIMFIYGLIYLIVAKLINLSEWNDLKIVYGFLCIWSLVCFHLGLFYKLKKKIFFRHEEEIFDWTNIIMCLVYLLWGISCLYISLEKNKEANFYIWLIVFAFICSFFYFRWQVSVSLFVVSYIFATISFLTHLGSNMPRVAAFNLPIIGILLLSHSILKYSYAKRTYQAERENESLLNEMEGQNEELVAVNEDLENKSKLLENANRELEKSYESTKAFTAAMNHELRSPLNGIIGNVQVLLLDDDLSDEARQNITSCMSSAHLMLGIVNDLLDVNKLSSGEFEILKAPFDLHSIIFNTQAMLNNVALNKRISLGFDIDDDTVCGLVGDDFRIQQVLTNLVSNGIKYTAEGTVVVKAEVKNLNLILSVSDTGQGIEESLIPIIFEPFKRVNSKENARIQGTGLGLPIAKGLVEKMGGKIEVSSIVGKGSTFVVTIPTEISDETNTWKREKSRTVSTDVVDVPDFSGFSIFCVDDTMLNLTIIKSLLKKTNIKVYLESNPHAALETLRKEKFDLIFVDHMMPEISGVDIFKTIKNDNCINSDTRFIIFTGNSGTGVEDKYRKIGFYGYLSKPIMREELFKIIESGCGDK